MRWLSNDNLDLLSLSLRDSTESGAQYITNDNCGNKRALNYCLLNQGGKLWARVYLTALLTSRANHANYKLECLRLLILVKLPWGKENWWTANHTAKQTDRRYLHLEDLIIAGRKIVRLRSNRDNAFKCLFKNPLNKTTRQNIHNSKLVKQLFEQTFIT